MNFISTLRPGVYEKYTGLFVFLISVLVSLQFIWVVEHQRPEETVVRSLVAALVGLLVGMAMIRAVERFFSPVQGISQRIAGCLWPGFLLLFMPFHVRSLCRWQDECGYLGDIFMLQFVTLGVGIFFAKSIYDMVSPKVALLEETRIGETIARHKFAFAFAFTLVILLIRGWGRFAHPEFFAEGGVVYFKGALRDGWSSLLGTYTGFLHVFPRLIVLSGFELLPLEYLTRFTVSMSFIVTAVVSANFVRDTYRWLVPSDTARWIVCVLLALVPGLFEILGTLTNLHYVMFVFVAMVFLRHPADKVSSLELVWTGLTVLSTSLTTGLIPLAAYRVYRKWSYRKEANGSGRLLIWRDCALLAMLCFPLFWSIQDIILNPTNAAITPVPVDLGFLDLIKGLVNISAIYYLLFPLAGNKAIDELLPYISPFVLLVPLAVFVIIRVHAIWRQDRVTGEVIALWLAAMATVMVMIFFARPVGFKVVFLTNWGHFAWWMRYNYLAAVPAVLMWFFLLQPRNLIDLTKTSTIVVFIIFSSTLFHSQYIFEIGRYSEQEYWKETVLKLNRSFATGCPRSVQIEIFPNREFKYKNPDSADRECPADGDTP